MTIFDHIIAGRVPASFAYRDDRCAAFLDIAPMSPGHLLVVPVQSVATLEELDPEVRAHLWDVALKVATAQRRALGSAAQHFLLNDGKDASQSVPHVHVHVIPRYRGDGLRTVLRMIGHVGALQLGRVPRETQALRARLDAQARAIAAAL